MAEGLARQMLGGRAVVESAGLMPMFESAAPEAVAVLNELFDVDISQHRPKNLTELSLDDYDRVIVLDAYVYNTLSKPMRDESGNLVLWDTEDPFGQDRETYERVARWLNSHLFNHLEPLLFD
jgi:protein-tyrosine-phosphatase